MHVALLGDSTFDNAAYTGGGPDVVTHLRGLLGASGRATLLARDGAVIGDVYDQMDAVRETLDAPAERASHLVVSVGGNDLLAAADVLGSPAGSVAEGLLLLADVAAVFGETYRALVDAVVELGLPTVLCTVYGGAFVDPAEARAVETALRVFDHEILDAGLRHGLPVLDLRRVCDQPEDYWNPIEPSERGGAKIAEAVLGALRTSRFDVGGPLVTLQGTGGRMR